MSYRRRGTSSSSYVQTDYGYDKADQLLQEENNASGASYFKGVYVYDQNGNRTSKALTVGTGSAVTTNFTYDAGDKMIAYGSYTIPYDAAGRPTQWPVNRPSTGYGLAYMNWDYEGRLTQMRVPGYGVPFFTNTYNGLNGRKVANNSGFGSLGYRKFARSDANVTAPVRSMSTGSQYSPTWTRVTPGVSRKTGSTTTYAHNGIKNEDAQSQTSTAISATKDYDAWGNVIGTSGTWQGIFGYGGPYGYQEDETGIKLLGNRFYDPGAGRFLTRDPIGAGRNWYAYCNNSPLTWVDPEGLDTYVFNGTKLKHFSTKGKLLATYEAVSGLPGTSRKDQGAKGRGPIPAGLYIIDPSEDQFASFNPISIVLPQGYPWYESGGWGNRRIPLKPAPGTKNLGRDGFFLHGGDYKGSAGCIDIGHNEVTVIDAIGKRKDKQKLVVDYSQWTGVTPGGKW